MPASYLQIIGGRIKEILAVVTSAGAGSAGAIPALDASGKLDVSVMPSGVGVDTVSATFSEAVAAGSLVNLYNNSGVLTARNADNSNNTKPVHGYVISAVSSGATGTVYKEGTVTGLSGLTPGTRLYLGTAGAVATSAPTGAGKISQYIGEALSTTTSDFEPDDYIELAQ